MLNISGVNEGYVLDHIKAETALKVYHDLGLEQHDYTVAIIMNVKSNKMGKKDILKIECPIGSIDLDVLGFIDHNITVNIVKNGFIADKLKLELPKEVHNVIRCKNPRCISTIEQELEQVFILTDPEHEVYRCKYCEEKYERK